jgi:hypothetical protein
MSARSFKKVRQSFTPDKMPFQMTISIPKAAPIRALSWEQGQQILAMLTPSKVGISAWSIRCQPER